MGKLYLYILVAVVSYIRQSLHRPLSPRLAPTLSLDPISGSGREKRTFLLTWTVAMWAKLSCLSCQNFNTLLFNPDGGVRVSTEQPDRQNWTALDLALSFYDFQSISPVSLQEIPPSAYFLVSLYIDFDIFSDVAPS